MKKGVLVAWLVLSLSLASNAAVRFGLAIGYSPGGTLASGVKDSKFDGALTLGFGMAFDLTRFIGLEVRGTWARHTVSGSVSALSQGTLTIIPLEVYVVGRFPMGGKFFPYFFCGGGYSLNHFALDSGVAKDWSYAGFQLAESIDNSPSLSAGAGLDFFAGRSLILTMEGKMVISNAGSRWSISDIASQTNESGTLSGMALNRLVIGFSLKYQF